MLRAAYSSRLPGLALAALAAASQSSCVRDSGADILQLSSLGPRVLEVGDRVELQASNLPPAADLRRLSVTFRGTLARPGRAPCAGPVQFTLEDPPADATTTDARTGQLRALTYAESTQRTLHLSGAGRLEFTVTEPMLAALTRCVGQGVGPIDVPHATLLLGTALARDPASGVTVRIEGLGGEQALTGTLRGATLDLFAPPSRRVSLESGAVEQAHHLLDWLGVELAPGTPAEGGVRVASVRSDSPAERAGLLSGDALVRADGLNVLALADLVAPPSVQHLALTVQRGDVLEDRAVSLEGFAPTAPADLLAATIALGVLMALGLALLLPKPAWLAWLERRFVRALHARREQPLRGFVRDALARTLDLARGHAPSLSAPHDDVRAALPYLVVAALCSAVVLVPLGPSLGHSELDLGTLYALAALARLATVLLSPGGASVLTPRALVRAFVRATPCTLPAMFAVAGAVLLQGTFGVASMVSTQGGSPWSWTVARAPFAPLLALLFLPTVLSYVPWEPADRDAPAPVFLLARRRLHAVFEWTRVGALCVLASVLFLGGWRVPGVTFAEQDAAAGLGMLGALVLLAKSWSLLFAVATLRHYAPALHLEQEARTLWRTLLLAVLASGAALALWLGAARAVGETAQRMIAHGTFASLVLLLVWPLARRALGGGYATRSAVMTGPASVRSRPPAA